MSEIKSPGVRGNLNFRAKLGGGINDTNSNSIAKTGLKEREIARYFKSIKGCKRKDAYSRDYKSFLERFGIKEKAPSDLNSFENLCSFFLTCFDLSVYFQYLT